ncbi:hypothetical protein AB4Y89_16945 [Terriglobus sp. 2YAB30_2]|uniref:hypothetical protein n=2 Tax=unclassified Terriglobus TaxID=2628988 RepID=UPI003F973597
MCDFGRTLIVCILITGMTLTSVAQHAPATSKTATAVKEKVEGLTAQAHITVIRTGAPEEFGDFISHSQDGFTFYDVDQKQDVTLRYDEVKKIKDGYGGYNSIQGRHTDRSKGLMIALVLVGVLGALIGAAAAAK